MKELPVTIIMLTLNEEHHLPGAIENVGAWAEDIFIVDSCSTDKTVDIALEHDVNIVQRRFTDFGDQWNFAMEQLPIITPWTMKLDPDERLTSELMQEIGQAVQSFESFDGYWIPRRLWFMGKSLHVKQDVLRLWKTGKCRFSDLIVNEHPIISGRVGRLNGLIEHYDSPDLYHWLEKQNRYTTLEAIMKLKGDRFAVEPNVFGSFLQRRMFMKKYFNHLPFRFQLLALYLLLKEGAWRDGSIGRAWVHLRVEVMRMIEFKYEEMRRKGEISEIAEMPRAPHGTYDPRILESPLQRLVTSADL